jgi:hypothetical protein
MSRNIERLGNVIMKRMAKTVADNDGVAVEMGTINSNMTLTPDSLQVDIPQGDYLIQSGISIDPGDRVLIAWADSEPVVLGTASEEEAPPVTVTSDGQGNVTITY